MGRGWVKALNYRGPSAFCIHRLWCFCRKSCTYYITNRQTYGNVPSNAPLRCLECDKNEDCKEVNLLLLRWREAYVGLCRWWQCNNLWEARGRPRIAFHHNLTFQSFFSVFLRTTIFQRAFSPHFLHFHFSNFCDYLEAQQLKLTSRATVGLSQTSSQVHSEKLKTNYCIFRFCILSHLVSQVKDSILKYNWFPSFSAHVAWWWGDCISAHYTMETRPKTSEHSRLWFNPETWNTPQSKSELLGKGAKKESSTGPKNYWGVNGDVFMVQTGLISRPIKRAYFAPLWQI